MSGRRRAALLALVVAAALTAAAPAPAPAAPLTVVRATADATVRADHPHAPDGRGPTLRVAPRPPTRTYLRFRVTGLKGRLVRSATLWVRVDPDHPWRGLTAAPTDGRAWSERRLTWRTRPAAGSPVAAATRAPGTWRAIDVTPLVRANGRLDLVLTAKRGASTVLASREAGRADAPRLRLRTVRDVQPRFPVRTALYDAQRPTGRDHPARGRYDGGNPLVMAAQLGDLAWGHFGAALVPWAGPGTSSDGRLGALLAATDTGKHRRLRWAAEPAAELTGTPTPARIATLLAALDRDHARDAAYLRVDGLPVIFVPLAPGDGCGSLRRWAKGNAVARFHLVYETWPGSAACTGATPDDWFSLQTITADSIVARTTRDLPAWDAAVRGLTAAPVPWQLVDSYNDWSEGSAVEPATEWASPSGHGLYLDALHADGAGPPDTTTIGVAAGDIGCSIAEAAAATSTDTCQAAATAKLARSLNPSFVATMGDDVHGQATPADYQAQYTPTWGPLAALTHPAVGNHQYCAYQCADPAAAARAGYFAYWGARAGTPGQGWYSYAAGPWHVIVLSSECNEQGGCGAGSPMETWLRQDLAAHPTPCTLAYWHRPRFTGGHEGEASQMGAVWTDLYRSGVELVLNGHQHDYERFAPQAPDRRPDPDGGITEIVAGTGGRSHIPTVTVRPNTVVQNSDTFGVIRLELHPQGWSLRFLPAPGLGTFTDSAAGNCH